MIISRAEHPSWLSNAYLVADGDGGHGVLVDSNGVEDPLLEEIERRGITITHVLVTHAHPDHVVRVGELGRRFGVPVLAHPLSAGGRRRHGHDRRRRRRRARATSRSARWRRPGHCRDHLALLVDGTDCLTADCLFKGTVGGTMGGGETGYADQVHSIMDVLMALPHETRVHPGHVEATTVGDRVGAEPVHPHLARPRPGGHRARARCAASRPR